MTSEGGLAVEDAVRRALHRALGDVQASAAMDAFLAHVGVRWSDDAALALVLVRHELVGIVAALADRGAADTVLAELERALGDDEAEGDRRPSKIPTPPVPMPAVSEPPPQSGPTLKPHLRIIVATREFSEVSLVDRILPLGRAVLLTKPTKLSQYTGAPGTVSVLVYDARNPTFDQDDLVDAVRAQAAAIHVVIRGPELFAPGRLEQLSELAASVVTLPSTASATALARACLDVAGGGVPLSRADPSRR